VRSVRPATRADAQRCVDLCASALQELSGLRGGPLFSRRETGPVAKALLRPGGLERLMTDPRRSVLVGLSEGNVVGLAIGRIEEVGEALLGVVDAYYVLPEARRAGLAAAMLDSLTGWMDQKGCRAVDAPALPGQRSAKSLFESAGFKARLITMHRELS
jgi:GNAT superfamily N-acetyltransferase